MRLEALRSTYDAQLRGRRPERLPAGVEVESDGPLLRFRDPRWRGFIDYRDSVGSRAAISTR